ncbi:MAG: DUF2651 family protein [Clostridia bacterium]|nr:DUF2651 family protein [Clostridia bacterium]
MGNLLLLLFALPVATIIIASILETLLNSPLKVTALAFAIYLIVAFAAFDASFLIYVIGYTILALISAVITRVIINFINDDDDDEGCGCGCGCNMSNNDIIVQNTNPTNNCGCGCQNRYYGRYYR